MLILSAVLQAAVIAADENSNHNAAQLTTLPKPEPETSKNIDETKVTFKEWCECRESRGKSTKSLWDVSEKKAEARKSKVVLKVETSEKRKLRQAVGILAPWEVVETI